MRCTAPSIAACEPSGDGVAPSAPTDASRGSETPAAAFVAPLPLERTGDIDRIILDARVFAFAACCILVRTLDGNVDGGRGDTGAVAVGELAASPNAAWDCAALDSARSVAKASGDTERGRCRFAVDDSSLASRAAACAGAVTSGAFAVAFSFGVA